MKPFSAFFLATVVLSSCHSVSGPSTGPLTDRNLYSIDTVRMAVPNGDEKAARKSLQEALDSYKKGGDTARTIALLKRSIFAKPTAKAYFDLSGALLATRGYGEAIKALAIAEKLGYSPLANVMFRYAYAYANLPEDLDALPNSAHVTRYMELAIQMGYAHPRQFLQKELFPNAARNSDFEAVFTSALSGGAVTDPSRSLWNAFEGQFPEISLPLVIDRSWLGSHKREAYIDIQYEKFIPEMRGAKFSREGGDTYYYVARIHKEPGYEALLYCDASEMGDDSSDEEPLFTLVTYDSQGKIIDRMAVAGRKNLSSPFLVFSMQPSLEFRVQEFKRIYKSDPESAGYDSSNIKGEEPQAPVQFRIAANGKLERMDAPLALR